jgi:hypothetical protein
MSATNRTMASRNTLRGEEQKHMSVKALVKDESLDLLRTLLMLDENEADDGTEEEDDPGALWANDEEEDPTEWMRTEDDPDEGYM